MVTASLPTKAGTIINLNMDKETAAQHVVRIREHVHDAGNHLAKARNLLWELREYNGWKALGYKSWRACALEEFGQCSSMLYKELRAAQVELQLDSPIGTHNERVLRPLTKAGYSPETRQILYNVAQELVGEGGKVTSGTIEAVVTGLQEMLASGATQDSNGVQTPLTTRMQADLLARVREKKIAHKEHVRRMDAKRNYILGGVQAEKITRGQLATGKVAVILPLDEMQREILITALRSTKPIYVSLWTESNESPE